MDMHRVRFYWFTVSWWLYRKTIKKSRKTFEQWCNSTFRSVYLEYTVTYTGYEKCLIYVLEIKKYIYIFYQLLLKYLKILTKKFRVR